MPLSAAEQQELAELEELDRLEAEEAAAGGRSPALQQSPPKEEGLKSSLISPANMGRNIMELLGIDTQAAAKNGINHMMLGHLPQAVGAVKAATGNGAYVDERDKAVDSLARDMKRSPKSSIAGGLLGDAVLVGATGGAVKPSASVMGRIGQQAGMGGIQGALYNPGDKKGIVDPLQVKDRAINGGIGTLIGGAGGALGELASKGARVAEDIGHIKNGEMATIAKDSIDDAVKGVNDKQIAPRSSKLKEFLTGKNIELDPDNLESVVPQYAEKLRARNAPTPGPNMLGSSAPPTAPTVPVDANKALRLRRGLDSTVNYGKSKPFDPVATARGDEAKAVADSIRGKLSNLGPEVGQINGEMAETMALRDALADRARSGPIAAISGKDASDKGQLVKMIDKMAGSNLEGLGNRIDTAEGLMIDPRSMVNVAKPLEAAKQYIKLGIRGGVSLADGLNKAPVGTKEVLLNQALEAKRRAK